MKNKPSSTTVTFSVTKKDEGKKIVYGVVYAPNMLDSHGSFATNEEVERMAHRFMRLDLTRAIDVDHDSYPSGSYPVESYIARAGNKEFKEGSWVMGVKITDSLVWDDITSGRLNAFSMEIMTAFTPSLIQFYSTAHHFGETKDESDHTHFFFVNLDERGKVISGRTSIANGHSHEITVNSVTDQSNDHSHRYFLG